MFLWCRMIWGHPPPPPSPQAKCRWATQYTYRKTERGGGANSHGKGGGRDPNHTTAQKFWYSSLDILYSFTGKGDPSSRWECIVSSPKRRRKGQLFPYIDERKKGVIRRKWEMERYFLSVTERQWRQAEEKMHVQGSLLGANVFIRERMRDILWRVAFNHWKKMAKSRPWTQDGA